MVLMNYHEMTMNEGRDSPARRRQFLLICGVMAAAFTYSTVAAGMFSALHIQTDETFPGGTFVYKSTKRDYAAAGSLERHVLEEFGFDNSKRNRIAADTSFSIFLDNPSEIQDGRRTRFASGLILTQDTAKELADQKKTLMAKNAEIKNPTRNEVLELSAFTLWTRLKFKETKLPSAKVNLVHFPFTNGFISSLLLEYRILPALRRSMNDPTAVIFSTCSVPDSMCTHYATTHTAYLLGQPDSVQYQAKLPPPRSWIMGLDDMDRMLGTLSFGKRLGFGKKNAGVPADRDEL